MFLASTGMAAASLLHVVVKLQGTDELRRFMKDATLAAQVFKNCKLRARCQEGILQDASGLDLAEDGTEKNDMKHWQCSPVQLHSQTLGEVGSNSSSGRDAADHANA